jgi:hypothetical protein
VIRMSSPMKRPSPDFLVRISKVTFLVTVILFYETMIIKLN